MSYTIAQMRQRTTARAVMLSVHDADDWEWICDTPQGMLASRPEGREDDREWAARSMERSADRLASRSREY